MSMTEHGLSAKAAPERCDRCHDIHGPRWGAKECKFLADIYARQAKRQDRYRVRVAIGPNGKPL